jgi:hypothetical protein
MFAAIFVCYPATGEAAERGPETLYCDKATVWGEEMSANILLREEFDLRSLRKGDKPLFRAVSDDRYPLHLCRPLK